VRSLLCADCDALKIVVVEEDMTTIDSLTHISDAQLIARVTDLAGSERAATAALIGSLTEFDARRLYLSAGCSSLFTTQYVRGGALERNVVRTREAGDLLGPGPSTAQPVIALIATVLSVVVSSALRTDAQATPSA
jgi:hypothetical protein